MQMTHVAIGHIYSSFRLPFMLPYLLPLLPYLLPLLPYSLPLLPCLLPLLSENKQYQRDRSKIFFVRSKKFFVLSRKTIHSQLSQLQQVITLTRSAQKSSRGLLEFNLPVVTGYM